MDDAGERRIPQGSFLRESRCQVWPAAIRPQTPAMPRPLRAPDFGNYSGDDGPRWASQPTKTARKGRLLIPPERD